MTNLLRDGSAVLLLLAACGPATAESGDPIDETSATAGETSSSGSTESGSAGTEIEEPGPTGTGDVTESGGYFTTTGEPNPTSPTTDPTTGEPVEPACWQFELVVDSPGRTPAMALAPRLDDLVLGGTPTSSGLALVHEGAVSFEVEETLPDAGLFVKEVVPVGDEVVLFGSIPSDATPTGQALWMGRVDSGGDLLWSRELGSTHFNVWGHVDARVHPDGGFFVSTDDGVPGDDQALRLLRVDDAGETLWAHEVPVASWQEIAINWSLGAMDRMPDGVIQITGGEDDIRVIRSDDTGAVAWTIILADGIGWPRDVVGLPDGGSAVLTSTVDTAFLVRLDAVGGFAGLSEHKAGPDSNATSLAYDPATDSFLIAGGTRGVDGPDPTWERTWLVVTDGEGAVQWEHIGEPGTPSHIHDARVTGAGAFALTAHGEHLWVATVAACD